MSWGGRTVIGGQPVKQGRYLVWQVRCACGHSCLMRPGDILRAKRAARNGHCRKCSARIRTDAGAPVTRKASRLQGYLRHTIDLLRRCRQGLEPDLYDKNGDACRHLRQQIDGLLAEIEADLGAEID